MAYNLLEDIDIISSIYQSSTNTSVVNYNKLDSSFNEKNETIIFLYANLVLSCCILYSLILLIALYMNTKIINNKWNLSFIENIFGKRYYYYFIKLLTCTSKTNELWMFIGFIILIIASLISIFIGYFLISHLDLISELFKSSNNN